MAGYIKTIKQDSDVIYPVTTADAIIGLGAIDYSTAETDTGGTWIDGKIIYKKTINFGAFPASTTKAVSHGISNLDYVVKIEGTAKSSSGSYYPLPLMYRGNEYAYNTEIHIDSTNVEMYNGQDRSMYTAYVTIYYTKSS